jgi:hypothetical protein
MIAQKYVDLSLDDAGKNKLVDHAFDEWRAGV